MKPIKIFKVTPSLPDELSDLETIAYNLLWGWNEEAVTLFHRISPEIWEKSKHNPVMMLSMVSQEHYLKLSKDESFIAHMERVIRFMDSYLTSAKWFEKAYPEYENTKIAYFSLEFGLNDCFPNYSGGLGVLSGDHLKSSADLGIPLVAVALLYGQGYMTQYLSDDGWQHEKYIENDFENLPIKMLTNENQEPLKISVKMADREVFAEIWLVKVGNISVYALNTNIPENCDADKFITERLYGGDENTRIMQEILIGIGGMRALRKVGIMPTVIHMNEGHSAFLILERIRQLMSDFNLSYEEAKLIAASTNVFTTHTPVPAGNEVFPTEMVEHYLGYFREELGLTKDQFFNLARQRPENDSEPFNMTVLALNNSHYCNGVSKLHAEVSRKMWSNIWPDLHHDEIPIISIKNGIHPNSWISGDMAELFTRYLGPRWLEEPGDQDIWQRISQIPDAELWNTHERRRERLVSFIRRKLKNDLICRGAQKTEVDQAEEVLHPDVLTIGFARRFATYKRATLLFRDIARLTKILTNRDHPVQIIFAGKAHPRDDAGKDLIRQIIHISRIPELRRHIVFIEDYDINVARYLVQGCDVWLNTPRRPLEASGTSGMKVLFNGGINLSTLDGWWEEAYNGRNGWAIGRGEEYQDHYLQDQVESFALYELLENEVIPKFYNRGRDGLPRKWIRMIKSSMQQLSPIYNTNRMLTDYTKLCYISAHVNWNKLSEHNFTKSHELGQWWDNITQNWNSIKINEVFSDTQHPLEMGQELEVKATINLGKLTPEEVLVEIYYGKISATGEIEDFKTVKMTVSESNGDSNYTYSGKIPCQSSGKKGFSVRILPYHQNLSRKFLPGMIHWANS
ncbi:MAG: alpha-glucan family phosphorylase [bacterium]